MNHGVTVEQAWEHHCCSYLQNCQGDKCMAWRWVYEQTISPEAKHDSVGRYSIVRQPISKKTNRGYCGLVN